MKTLQWLLFIPLALTGVTVVGVSVFWWVTHNMRRDELERERRIRRLSRADPFRQRFDR